jgi:hypothetical protein
LVAAAIFAACGGGDDETKTPTRDSTEETEAPDDTEQPEDTEAPDATDAPDTTAGDVTTPETGAPSPTLPTDTTEPADTTTPDTDPAATGEGWTVLVYSIADTDLEPFLLEDVGEMGQVGSSDGLDIVALVDRAVDYSSEPVLGLDDWQGAKLLHIGDGTANVLEEYGEINTGDPQVLQDFVAQGIANNPAEHYALVITDHGASWPGVGGDESAGHDGLTLAEMNDAISAGLDQAGVDKLDLLGFDACLMATYEVASMLAPLADRLIASQELEPGHGWDYRALQVLEQDPATDVDTLGSLIIDGFEAQATELGTDSGITLSMIDLNQMAAVDEAVTVFTDALVERAADLAPIIGRTRENTLSFGRSPDPEQDTQMTDLGILASQIGIEALDVSDQADSLIKAINDAVVDSVAGSSMQGATGLSVYFPPFAQLFDSDYGGVESSTQWSEFLASFYEAGANIPEEEQPEFSDAEEDSNVFFDEDGVNIFGTFDIAAQDNLAVATISYGIVDEEDGSVIFIGEEPAQIADDGSGTALGIYDLTALTITDGIDTAYAYLALEYDDETETATIDVPLAYYAPDSPDVAQDVLLTLTLDLEGNILNEIYYVFDEEAGTYGELTADPTGIIVPEVLFISADGAEAEWVPTSDVGLFADLPQLQYELEPLESGTELYVDLTVTDFGGNSDSIFAQVVVP